MGEDVCIHTQWNLVLKKKNVLTLIATWMNHEDTMLSEISHSQDKHCVILLTCGPQIVQIRDADKTCWVLGARGLLFNGYSFSFTRWKSLRNWLHSI